MENVIDLQEQLEQIIPEQFGFGVFVKNENSDIICNLSIWKNGVLIETKVEDSLFWALKYLINYFTNLKP